MQVLPIVPGAQFGEEIGIALPERAAEERSAAGRRPPADVQWLLEKYEHPPDDQVEARRRTIEQIEILAEAG